MKMPERLLTLSSRAQYRSLERSLANASKNVLISTRDLALAEELESNGSPFQDEWELLSPEEIRANRLEAQQLARSWWPDGADSARWRGISLAEMASQELAFPFEAALNATSIFSKLLPANFRVVSAFGGSPTPILRTAPPVAVGSDSVACAILRFWTERQGLTFEDLGEPPDQRWVGDVVGPPIPHRPFGAVEGDRIALLLDNGLASSEVRRLQDLFARAEGWSVLRLSELSHRGMRMWGSNMNPRGWELLDRAWRDFKKQQLTYNGDRPELFANPHLDFQFLGLWREMRTAVAIGLVAESIFELVEPSLVVLGHDAFTVERTIVNLAHQHQIPTASLPHSGLAPTLCFDGLLGDSQHFLVWGSHDTHLFEGTGVERERLLGVGSLRYLPAPAAVRSQTETSSSRPPRRRVVILSAATHLGLAQPVARASLHRRAWRDLLELARTHPEWSFDIKPHPSHDHFDLYDLLSEEMPPNMRVAQGDLDLALDGCDSALLVNYCTSAALAAIIKGIAVIDLDTAIYPGDWFRSPIEESMIRASSVDELEAILEGSKEATSEKGSSRLEEEVRREVLGESERSIEDRLLEAFVRISTEAGTGVDLEAITDRAGMGAGINGGAAGDIALALVLSAAPRSELRSRARLLPTGKLKALAHAGSLYRRAGTGTGRSFISAAAGTMLASPRSITTPAFIYAIGAESSRAAPVTTRRARRFVRRIMDRRG